MCKEVAGENGQVGSLGENGESLEGYKERAGVGKWSQRRQGPGQFLPQAWRQLDDISENLQVAPATFSQLTPGSLGLWTSKVSCSFC